MVYTKTLKASAFFGNFKLVGSNTSHIALKHYTRLYLFAYLDQKGAQEQKQQHCLRVQVLGGVAKLKKDLLVFAGHLYGRNPLLILAMYSFEKMNVCQ